MRLLTFLLLLLPVSVFGLGNVRTVNTIQEMVAAQNNPNTVETNYYVNASSQTFYWHPTSTLATNILTVFAWENALGSPGRFISQGYKVADPVRPQWWGAKGDGVTDDGPAIQAMFASGVASAYFPTGTYRITQPIVVQNTVAISGGGRQASVIKLDSTFPLTVLVVTNASKVKIQSLGISYITFAAQHIGVEWWNTTNCVLDDVEVLDPVPIGSPNIGLYIHGQQQGLVRNCNLVAGQPLRVGTNALVTTNSLDTFMFRDNTMTCQNAANYNILFDVGVIANQVTFDGVTLNKGSGGFQWTGPHQAARSSGLSFKNFNWVSPDITNAASLMMGPPPPLTASGYGIDIELGDALAAFSATSTNEFLQGLTIADAKMPGLGNGIKLHGVYAAQISNTRLASLYTNQVALSMDGANDFIMLNGVQSYQGQFDLGPSDITHIPLTPTVMFPASHPYNTLAPPKTNSPPYSETVLFQQAGNSTAFKSGVNIRDGLTLVNPTNYTPVSLWVQSIQNQPTMIDMADTANPYVGTDRAQFGFNPTLSSAGSFVITDQQTHTNWLEAQSGGLVKLYNNFTVDTNGTVNAGSVIIRTNLTVTGPATINGLNISSNLSAWNVTATNNLSSLNSASVSSNLTATSATIGGIVMTNNMIGNGLGPLGALDLSGPTGSKSWSYFRGNVNGGGNPPGMVNGLSLGWNVSGVDGEERVMYPAYIGSNPRLGFWSWDGTNALERFSLFPDGHMAIANSNALWSTTGSLAMPGPLNINGTNAVLDMSGNITNAGNSVSAGIVRGQRFVQFAPGSFDPGGTSNYFGGNVKASTFSTANFTTSEGLGTVYFQSLYANPNRYYMWEDYTGGSLMGLSYGGDWYVYKGNATLALNNKFLRGVMTNGANVNLLGIDAANITQIGNSGSPMRLNSPLSSYAWAANQNLATDGSGNAVSLANVANSLMYNYGSGPQWVQANLSSFKIDAADNADGFLTQKLIPGSGVLFVTNNVGAYESITMSVTNLSGGGTNYAFQAPLTQSGSNVLIAANGINNGLIRSSAGNSVIGRSTASSGNVNDIAATANGQFLGMQSSTLGFLPLAITNHTFVGSGTITATPAVSGTNITWNIADNLPAAPVVTNYTLAAGNASTTVGTSVTSGTNVAWTVSANPGPTYTFASPLLLSGTTVSIPNFSIPSASLRASPPLSVMGNPQSAGGVVSDIVSTGNGQFLGQAGSFLNFYALGITNYNVTAGSGITVSPSTSGTNTTYTVAAIPPAPLQITNYSFVAGANMYISPPTVTSGTNAAYAFAVTGMPPNYSFLPPLSVSGTPPVVSLPNNSIGNATLQQVPASSLLGNPTTASANASYIPATADYYVLTRSGGALGFAPAPLYGGVGDPIPNAYLRNKIIAGANVTLDTPNDPTYGYQIRVNANFPNKATGKYAPPFGGPNSAAVSTSALTDLTFNGVAATSTVLPSFGTYLVNVRVCYNTVSLGTVQFAIGNDAGGIYTLQYDHVTGGDHAISWADIITINGGDRFHIKALNATTGASFAYAATTTMNWISQ
jgi:hypothetical protein